MDVPKWAGYSGQAGQGDGDGAHGQRRPRDPGKKAKGRMLKATCGCDRSFRISRSVLEIAGITCRACHQDFTLDDDRP